MKKLLLGMIAVIIFFSLPLIAITADEYFEFASSKYLQEDIEGALKDLSKALEINPKHVGALELKALIDEEGLMSVEEEKAVKPVTDKTILSTTSAQPVLSPTPPAPPLFVPVRREIIVTEGRTMREKLSEAHQYFLRAEEYFEAGDYVWAEKHFLRVLTLLPGHEGSKKYLEEIKLKLVSLTPEVAAEEKLGFGAFVSRFVERYGVRLIMLSVLMTIVLLLVFILAVRFCYGWWRARHTYCAECRTRNPNEAEFCRKCGFRLKAPKLTEDQKEWFSKFGWSKNPFTLSIIADVYTGHQAEISMIIEKLNILSGHILVIGGLGTGKTTLLQWLEKNLKDKFETIYILRPPVRPDELIDLISATIAKKTNQTRKYSVYEFQELCKKYKRNILLLLDEAHEFKEEFEQFLRTLGDLPNIYLLMAGLPQAREKLKRDLPALFDRIVESILLGSLTQEETKELILKRIVNAGGKGLGPFSASAVDKIYDLSYGIPRGILKICDWVVTQAMRANKTYIDDKDINAYSEEVEAAKLQDFKNIKKEKTSHG